MKRIRFEILGKPVSISRKDWLMLRKRFDYTNAERRKNFKVIEIKCSLCQGAGDACEGCTLNKLRHGNDRGCTAAIRHLLGKKINLVIREDEIFWRPKDDRKVKKQLKKVLDFMDKMEVQND